MTEANDFSLVGVDSGTGLPIPVTISRQTLRDALVNNPDIVTDIIRGASSLPINEIDKTRINGRLPVETKIIDMLDPERVKQLSPAVQRLTKADLMALGGWAGERKSAAALGLAVKDIQTIREVFGQGMQPGNANLMAVDVSCCCCTPCCCAAAQTRPQQKVA